MNLWQRQDWIVIGLVFFVGVFLTLMIYRPFSHFDSDETLVVEVRENGSVIRQFPLSENTEKSFSLSLAHGRTGTNTISIQDGKVRMKEADCSDHICVRSGTISHAGDSIVCLPHRFVVQIVKKDGTGDLDAIVQ